MNVKKIFAGALTGVMLAAVSSVSLAAGADEEIKLGDPTGNGIIDAVDASNILGLYSEVSINVRDITDEDIAACDVNKDGRIDAVDASLVLSYYVSQTIGESDVTIEEFIEELLNEVKPVIEDILNNWEWPQEGEYSWENISDSNPWLDLDEDIWPFVFTDPETGEPIDLTSPWDPASSYDPTISTEMPEDWASWLPDGFFDNDNPWTWPPTES